MKVKRGEIWIASLDPTEGSEQAGTRPVFVFQNDVLSKYTTTVLAIPLTKTLQRASIPFCVSIPKGEGGLTADSVALCFQLRVLDKKRLQRKLGVVSKKTLDVIEDSMLHTMGI